MAMDSNEHAAATTSRDNEAAVVPPNDGFGDIDGPVNSVDLAFDGDVDDGTFPLPMMMNGGGGDGLMHDDHVVEVATTRTGGRGRSLCRYQRLCCRCVGIACLALVVFLVAVIAAGGLFSVDDTDEDAMAYGMENTIYQSPIPPAGQHHHHPAMAPVHSSFDQPSIAGNDPVGNAPSVTAGDVGGNQPPVTWAPTTPYQATLPKYTQKSMRDPSSAQSKAWTWLKTHPDMETMEDWRKEQLLAMTSFYYSFNGDKWTEKEKKNWLSFEFNECHWGARALHENECTSNKEITILRLEDQDQSIKGSSPHELALLTSLQRFEMFNMKFTDTRLHKVLPARLADLPALDRIRLSDNQLSGTIPSYLGDFTPLTSLNLRSNHLHGTIATELGRMTNLKYLTLYGNKLEGSVPTELAQLTNLISLSLQDNQLSGSLPAALCALTNLSKLEVDCQRTKCPMECDCQCKDPKLIRGTATPTTTTPHPESLTPFPTITPHDGIILGLQQHSLDALAAFNTPQFFAYAWLLNHPQLDKMPEWRKEQLFGVVTFYHAFSGVWSSSERNLWLSYDFNECDWGIGLCDFDNRFLEVTLEDAEGVNAEMLGGSLPRELGMLSQLEDIELYGLGIKADMETLLPILELQYLPIHTINLQGNQLYGSIPTNITSLRTLRNLSFARNVLTGRIPTQLGLLQDLTHLTLHENGGLGGTLPSELGRLSQLKTLWLDRTGIAGTVPTEICNLPSLETLRVDCAKVPCPDKCNNCQCFHSG